MSIIAREPFYIQSLAELSEVTSGEGAADNANWSFVDLNQHDPHGVPSNATGVVMVYHTYGANHRWRGIRKSGSTTPYYLESTITNIGFIATMPLVDGGFEVYLEGAAGAWVVGYTDDTWAFFDETREYSQSGNPKTLPGDIPANATALVRGFRSNYNWRPVGGEYVDGSQGAFVHLDENNQFESQDSNITYMGHTTGDISPYYELLTPESGFKRDGIWKELTLPEPGIAVIGIKPSHGSIGFSFRTPGTSTAIGSQTNAPVTGGGKTAFVVPTDASGKIEYFVEADLDNIDVEHVASLMGIFPFGEEAPGVRTVGEEGRIARSDTAVSWRGRNFGINLGTIEIEDSLGNIVEQPITSWSDTEIVQTSFVRNNLRFGPSTARVTAASGLVGTLAINTLPLDGYVAYDIDPATVDTSKASVFQSFTGSFHPNDQVVLPVSEYVWELDENGNATGALLLSETDDAVLECRYYDSQNGRWLKWDVTLAANALIEQPTYTDNFDRPDGELGPDWQRRLSSMSTYTKADTGSSGAFIEDGRLRFTNAGQSEETPAILYTGAMQPFNPDCAVEIDAPPNPDCRLYVTLRAFPVITETNGRQFEEVGGYTLQVWNDRLRVIRKDSSGYSLVQTVVGVALKAGDESVTRPARLRLAVRDVEAGVECAVYDAANPAEPLAVITDASEEALRDGGSIALAVNQYGGAGDYLDNLQVFGEPIEEPEEPIEEPEEPVEPEPDTTPEPFTVAPVTDAEPGAWVEFAPVEMTGVDANLNIPVVVEGAEFAVSNNAGLTWDGWFTSSQIRLGDLVKVRMRASETFADERTGLLTIGGVSAALSLTTKAAPLPVQVSPIPARSLFVGQSVVIDVAGNFSGAVSYSATGLPPGLIINPETGRISGEPAEAVVAQVVVTATNASGSTESNQFVITVAELAKTYYVSVEASNGFAVGDDGNDGLSREAPFATISAANLVAEKGDHIVVNAGYSIPLGEVAIGFDRVTTLKMGDEVAAISPGSGGGGGGIMRRLTSRLG